MKVNIYASALAFACSEYAKELAQRFEDGVANAMKPYNPGPKTEIIGYSGFWFWKSAIWGEVPQPDVTRTRAEAELFLGQYGWSKPPQNIEAIWAIARHKRPETTLEVTSEEIALVAKYLPLTETSRIE